MTDHPRCDRCRLIIPTVDDLVIPDLKLRYPTIPPPVSEQRITLLREVGPEYAAWSVDLSGGLMRTIHGDDHRFGYPEYRHAIMRRVVDELGEQFLNRYYPIPENPK